MIMPQSSGYGGQVVLAKVATGATLPLNIVATGLYDRIDGTTGIAIYPLEALTMTSDGIGGWMVI
jgi:hypothetical protein